MIEVRDGARTLQFDGKLIGESSSWRPGSERWIEFELYRTLTGIYVLARVGKSVLYHSPDCAVVRRNRPKESTYSDLSDDSRPCPQCRPSQRDFPLVFAEQPRHWAQQCDTPNAVRESLMKYDSAGSRYLTWVARDLLEDAASNDDRIRDEVWVEVIQ